MPPRPHGEESVLLSAPLLADVEEEGAGVAAVASAAGLVHADLGRRERLTIRWCRERRMQMEIEMPYYSTKNILYIRGGGGGEIDKEEPQKLLYLIIPLEGGNTAAYLHLKGSTTFPNVSPPPVSPQP